MSLPIRCRRPTTQSASFCRRPSWRRPATQSPNYLCAKVIGHWNDDASVGKHSWSNIKLPARRGVPARIYSFKEMVYHGGNNKDYAKISIRGCKKNGAGWKPVCDHPNYCKHDRKAIYLGQTHHVAYPGHRHNRGYGAADPCAREACAARAVHGLRKDAVWWREDVW